MSGGGLAPFYDGWRKCDARLVGALRTLLPEQLGLRASPSHMPIWAIAAHTAGARVYWLCGVFKETGAGTTPFTDPLSGIGWEDDESTPRGADELVFALDSSWKIVERCLERWTPSMLSDEFTREIGGENQGPPQAAPPSRALTPHAYHARANTQTLGLD